MVCRKDPLDTDFVFLHNLVYLGTSIVNFYTY